MINNIAVQLCMLQAECEQDLDKALSKISELGFSGVEFCTFFGKSPEEIVTLLKKNNLQVVGTHISLQEMIENFDENVKYQKAINCNKIIIPCGEIHDEESLSLLIDQLNGVNCKLRQHRIDLYYHNHEVEFEKYDSDNTAMIEILDRTDIFIELDTFWSEQAGANTIDLISTYSDRMQMIHLKDGENHFPKAIGEGKTNCKAIFDCANNERLEWIIIENDEPTPTGIDDLTRSINFIKNNY